MACFYRSLRLQDEISGRGCNESLVYAESSCTVTLRIRIDNQYSVASQTELRRDIND
jgi:hypothetical protein